MKIATFLAALLLCAALWAPMPQPAIAQQQSPTPDTDPKATARREGAITGRVVVADGRPLGDAQIIAMGVNAKIGEITQTGCNDEGNFKLTGLRTGAYRLFARMPGYVSQREEALCRTGDNVTIALVRGGVITGRVTDATGEPMTGVRVMPQMIRDLEGRRAALAFEMPDANSFGRLTDDRGVYRIYGLAPGVYVVGCNGSFLPFLSERNLPHESTTYHPSATRDTAVEITVRESAEVSGVDIRHRGERGHSISGTLSGAMAGDSIINAASILLSNATNGQIEAVSLTVVSHSFALYGVPDGEYEITAIRLTEDDNRASSLPRRISVKGADLTGIDLKLFPLGSIAGRVVIEKAAPGAECAAKENYAAQEISLRAHQEGPKVRRQSMTLFPFDFGDGSSLSVPNEKGEFALKNLEAGGYHIAADLPGENWYVRSFSAPPSSANAKRQDAARSPINLKQGQKLAGFELTIASGAASLAGKVVAAREGEKLPSRLRVHLIPAEDGDAVLRYAETAAAKDGSFEFKHLAPGKYLLLARSIPEAEANNEKPLPAAFEVVERAKLRREAESAKNEITLAPCQRAKDVTVKTGLEK